MFGKSENSKGLVQGFAYCAHRTPALWFNGNNKQATRVLQTSDTASFGLYNHFRRFNFEPAKFSLFLSATNAFIFLHSSAMAKICLNAVLVFRIAFFKGHKNRQSGFERRFQTKGDGFSAPVNSHSLGWFPFRGRCMAKRHCRQRENLNS